jgi:glucose uptake protein GlcU
MSESTYLTLSSMVSPLNKKKKPTTMLQAVTPHERLTATVKFLASGRSYEDFRFSTIISPQALGKIIQEVCRAIYKVLKEYCKVRVYNVKNKINNLLLWAICNTVLLKSAQSKNRYMEII